jgi:hypothetical protein
MSKSKSERKQQRQVLAAGRGAEHALHAATATAQTRESASQLGQSTASLVKATPPANMQGRACAALETTPMATQPTPSSRQHCLSEAVGHQSASRQGLRVQGLDLNPGDPPPKILDPAISPQAGGREHRDPGKTQAPGGPAQQCQ